MQPSPGGLSNVFLVTFADRVNKENNFGLCLSL